MPLDLAIIPPDWLAAWQAVVIDGNAQPGMRLLIAGEAVAPMTQIAKHRGCRVDVIANSREGAKQAETAGADAVHRGDGDVAFVGQIAAQGFDLVVLNACDEASLRTALTSAARIATFGSTGPGQVCFDPGAEAMSTFLAQAMPLFATGRFTLPDAPGAEAS